MLSFIFVSFCFQLAKISQYFPFIQIEALSFILVVAFIFYFFIIVNRLVFTFLHIESCHFSSIFLLRVHFSCTFFILIPDVLFTFIANVFHLNHIPHLVTISVGLFPGNSNADGVTPMLM